MFAVGRRSTRGADERQGGDERQIGGDELSKETEETSRDNRDGRHGRDDDRKVEDGVE